MNIALLTKKDCSYRLEIQSFFRGRVDYFEIFTDGPDEIDLDKFDLAIGYYYPHILRRHHLDALTYGAINIHPGLLPHGRGAHPNVWAIALKEPAGVTIHWMDDSIDTGPILHQMEVPVYETDTGKILYDRLQWTAVHEFFDFWPWFQAGLENDMPASGVPQTDTYYPTRRVSDLERLRNLDTYLPDPQMEGVKFALDIIRACTYPGYDGAYYTDKDGNQIVFKVMVRKEVVNEN